VIVDLAYIIELLNKLGFPVFISCVALYYGIKIANEIVDLVRRRIRGDTPTQKINRDTPGPHPAITDGDRRPLVRKTPDRERRPLKTHYFFTVANNLLANKISTIRCGCLGRTEVFRDMCTEMIRSWSEVLQQFIDDEKSSLNHAANYEFGADLADMIMKWRRDLKGRWLNISIPKPAVEAMLDWLEPRFDILAQNSAGLASSDFFVDNHERMAVVLSIHEMTMQLVIIDMNRLILSINGNLDGVVYKNIEIVPAKDVLTEYFERQKVVGGGGSSRSMKTPLPGAVKSQERPAR
jgi:hypothetical protein